MTREEYWNRVLQARKEQADREQDDEQEARERRYSVVRIPRGYWNVTLDYIPDELEYKRKIKSWHEKYLAHVQDGMPFPGLYLYGPLGTGKTAIAAGIMKWAVNHGITGIWLDYSEIVDAAANDPEYLDGVPEGMWSYARRAPIVAIDDLLRGGLSNSFSALQVRRVEELLRHRWTQGLTTIITGNGSLAQINDLGPESLAGVLEESCYDIEVSGAYFRGWKAQKKEPL